MSTTRFDHVRPRGPAIRRRPLSATLFAAALAIVAAGCLTLMAPIIWTAAKTAFQSTQPTLAQCALISADAERLACFDLLGKQALQPPAKGAYAPIITH